MAFPIQLIKKITFSSKQKKIFCEYDLSNNEDAQKQKRKYADVLADAYEHGSREISPDHWISLQYRRIADPDFIPPQSSWFRTNSEYTASRWYNFLRLYLLRIELIADFYGKSFLGKFFGIFGFAYVIDFLFESAVVLKTTFNPHIADFEMEMSDFERYKTRFINVMTKDERLPRMINSFLWGTLNVVTFFLTGGLSLILTAGGCFADLINSGTPGFKAYIESCEMLEKINQKLQQKNDRLQHLIEIEETRPLTPTGQKLKIKLQNDVERYKAIQAEAKKHSKEQRNKAFYTLFTSALVLVGFGLILFPPTAPVGAFLTALGLALNLVEKINEFREFIQSTLPDENEIRHSHTKNEVNNNKGLELTHGTCHAFFRAHKSEPPSPQESDMMTATKENTVQQDQIINKVTPGQQFFKTPVALPQEGTTSESTGLAFVSTAMGA